MSFNLEKIRQQCTEITTRAPYSNCNAQLNHKHDSCHCSGCQGAGCPHLPGRNTWVEASSSPLFSSRCGVLVDFYILCWAEPVLSVDFFREGCLHLLNWQSCLSTAKATLQSPWCWDKFSFSHDSCGCFLCSFLIFMSTSSMPVLSEPSSVIGIPWAVTVLTLQAQ